MQEVFEIICTKEVAAPFHRNDKERHTLSVQYGIGDEQKDMPNMRLKSRYTLKDGYVRLKFVSDPLVRL